MLTSAIKGIGCRIARHVAALVSLIAWQGFATMPALAQEPFTYLWVESGIEAASFGDLSWVDMDGDGAQDLLVAAGSGSSGTTPLNVLLRSERLVVSVGADGTRRVSASLAEMHGFDSSPPLWLAQVAWSDINLDGLIDAVISGTPSPTAPFVPEVRLYLNSGGEGGVFAERSLGNAVLGLPAWADFDNDGAEDLVLVGSRMNGDPATMLYRNDGGTLVETPSNLPDLHFGSAAWTDMDSDGDFDVALCGVTAGGSYFLGVFDNDGGGVFSPINVDGRGVAYCTLDWGDYDGDGFDDLLVTGNRIASTEVAAFTDVYRNEGGARLARQPFDLIGLAAGEGRFVDVDSDGQKDIVISGGSDVAFRRALVTIYRGDAATFTRVANLEGLFPAAMAVGDIDGDGDPDLAMIGLGQDRQAVTTVYLNGQLLVNSRPSIPSGLQTAVDGGSVALRWDPASDETTPTSTLTYNLRVGTTSGGNDVMSVPTRPDGGPVRSARGNVAHNTAWTIRGLPNGTYHWSVQAVDNGLATSDFSAEGIFQITASSATKPVGIDNQPGPLAVALLPPFPNPFSDVLNVGFELPRAGLVRVDAFDIVGRRVSQPFAGHLPVGRHTVTWQGQDDAGVPLAAGMYILRLSFEGEQRAEAVTVQR